MDEMLRRLRQAEIESLRRWFPSGSCVLEIGGGNGFQASIIASWGCLVTCYDLAGRPTGCLYAPVAEYDGLHIPAPAASFDRVYSSNVLEHVSQLPALLEETRRVLKPGGLAIHVLPTSAWRLWTSLTHYPHILRSLLQRAPGASLGTAPGSSSGPRTAVGLLRRALTAGPHGVYPSALSELYYFSKGRWQRLFEGNGFEILTTIRGGLFYTGYGLLPGLPLRVRQGLARIARSACQVFVLQPAR